MLGSYTIKINWKKKKRIVVSLVLKKKKQKIDEMTSRNKIYKKRIKYPWYDIDKFEEKKLSVAIYHANVMKDITPNSQKIKRMTNSMSVNPSAKCWTCRLRGIAANHSLIRRFNSSNVVRIVCMFQVLDIVQWILYWIYQHFCSNKIM